MPTKNIHLTMSCPFLIQQWVPLKQYEIHKDPRLSHKVCPETIHVHQTLEQTKISGSLGHRSMQSLCGRCCQVLNRESLHCVFQVYLMKNMSVLDESTLRITYHHPAEPLKHEMWWDDIITSIRATEKYLKLKQAASRSLGFAWWNWKERLV